MLAVNCAGLTDSLLESELFGHVRGSFTDAYRDKRGLLELADDGTLFMDEVGEMSLRMQALLLRFVENGEIQPVGSDKLQPTRVDVRLIAATNRDLVERCAQKEFRSDLYYRLNVIHIQIAALRERREDIPLLLGHFLAHYAQVHRVTAPELSNEALASLVDYSWPGNVRELMNVVEQLTVRHPDRLITPFELPREVGGPSRVDAANPVRLFFEPQALFERIVRDGESFWSIVYEPFMMRDITREQVRQVIRLGLQQTRGSYKALVPLLRMPSTDYKRFLNFLRKHQCQVPFQAWRAMSVAAALPVASADDDRDLQSAAVRGVSH
jgi:DNA-binding NtrC family response regulator